MELDKKGIKNSFKKTGLELDLLYKKNSRSNSPEKIE
jgi:hypothetical protein